MESSSTQWVGQWCILHILAIAVVALVVEVNIQAVLMSIKVNTS